MSTPRFSVIVPLFNMAVPLKQCLTSIARQTYSNYEVVVVDGGSTDDSMDVATEFAVELGERLVLHSGPDEGVFDAMNHGVGMASGEWVLFLGADDALYADHTLADIAAFLDTHSPSDLVYGDVLARSSGARYAGTFDLDRLLFEMNICHQAIVYRRELFSTIGPYNLRYRTWADWDFNIRCFSNPALNIRYMDIIVARWDNMSGMSSPRAGIDREFQKRLPKYFTTSARIVLKRTLNYLGEEKNRQAAWGSVKAQIRNRRQANTQNRISVMPRRGPESDYPR